LKPPDATSLKSIHSHPQLNLTTKIQEGKKKNKTHHPLPHEKPHPKTLRLKRNLTPLREIKHIAFPPRDFLPRLITNDKLAIDNDLHLMVRILIHQRRAFLKAVQAAGYWLCGVGAGLSVWKCGRAGGENVAKEGVFVGY